MSKRSRAERRRSRSAARFAVPKAVVIAAAAGLLLVAGVAAAVVAVFVLRSDGTDGPPSAVVIDQLSLTQPNLGFTEDVRRLLEPAGYEVDYVPGEAVTVDYFRELPERGYDIVLVRGHAGRHQDATGEFTDEAALFTGEAYSLTQYVAEQRNGLVTQVFYDETSTEAYFGIAPSFVRHSMEGDFRGAAVVLMGCDVLRGDMLAKSFFGQGAGSVIGWDGPVSAQHTDAATLSVLRHYLADGLSVEQATAAAMQELGPDPYYGASLLWSGP